MMGLAGARTSSAVLASIAVAILLTGCSANPVNRAVSRVFQMGSIGFPTDMTTKIIYAAVAVDEVPVSRLGRLDRNVVYDQGVEYGAAEESLRLVRVDMLNHGNGILKWMSIALVPDSFPLLRAGDVVAIRMPKPHDIFLDYARTGEGTAALALVCMPERAGYEQCWKNVPVENPKTRMRGANGIAPLPFRPKLSDYGLTFSPRFDYGGKLLSTAPTPPERADAMLMTERF